MDRSKLAPVASLVSLVAIAVAVACGGQIVDPTDVGPSPSGTSPGSADRPPTKPSQPTQSSCPTCNVENKKECPTLPPSEQDWCPWPAAHCVYQDTCSQRPATAATMRSYECTGSRWTWMSGRYDVTCPKEAPENGSACEPSCALAAPCDYTTACGNAEAICQPITATWHVAGKACASDGGADAATD